MDYITKRKDIEIMLIKKANDDPAFKKLLMSDPTSAIKSIGLQLPVEFNLKIIEEDDHELILVLPNLKMSDELSELELVNAAGGSIQNTTGGSSF